MSALTSDRDTPRRDGEIVSVPAAATVLYAGGMGAVNASGYAVPASADPTLQVAGRIEEYVDNSGGSAGDLNVPLRSGVFRFANSSSTDAIALADVGQVCFAADDQTVAKTSGGGTRPAAGEIVDVDDLGVWVRIKPLPAEKVHIPVDVADLRVASAGVYRFVAPVSGRITGLDSVLSGALATGDATVIGSIGGVDITGGVLTIAESGSAAGDTDEATPTALNAVTEGQVVALTVGGTNTANVSAHVMVEITL